MNPSSPSIHEARRALPLPTLLEQLIASGRWKHPGGAILLEKVPFIRERLVFLQTSEMMRFESGPLMAPEEAESDFFKEYRGSLVDPRDLPWIDVEKTLFIACNEVPGDDVGIALDYRPGLDRPRVVGGDWRCGEHLGHREIAPTFSAFVAMLGI